MFNIESNSQRRFVMKEMTACNKTILTTFIKKYGVVQRLLYGNVLMNYMVS
jgi:hypothetical protein